MGSGGRPAYCQSVAMRDSTSLSVGVALCPSVATVGVATSAGPTARAPTRPPAHRAAVHPAQSHRCKRLEPHHPCCQLHSRRIMTACFELRGGDVASMCSPSASEIARSSRRRPSGDESRARYLRAVGARA